MADAPLALWVPSGERVCASVPPPDKSQGGMCGEGITEAIQTAHKAKKKSHLIHQGKYTALYLWPNYMQKLQKGLREGVERRVCAYASTRVCESGAQYYNNVT